MHIVINIDSQTLSFHSNDFTKQYAISTSKNGIGQEFSSFKTPIGEHFIIEKSGENAPNNAYFKNRVPVGLINNNYKNEDYIVARVLRLSGCVNGLNLNSDCDSYKRMIYIHASHPLANLTKPSSLGCIRMYAKDICELFELVTIGCKVFIYEK